MFKISWKDYLGSFIIVMALLTFADIWQYSIFGIRWLFNLIDALLSITVIYGMSGIVKWITGNIKGRRNQLIEEGDNNPAGQNQNWVGPKEEQPVALYNFYEGPAIDRYGKKYKTSPINDGPNLE